MERKERRGRIEGGVYKYRAGSRGGGGGGGGGGGDGVITPAPPPPFSNKNLKSRTL